MKIKTNIILAFLFTTVFASVSLASDYAKEQRWIDEVADSIIDGDVEMLEVNGREVFSIYTEADENPKSRAIIVIHGIGAHPNWAQVVQPIRVDMTQNGWHTLSVQMPILANGTDGAEYAPLFDDVGPRIEAAIKFLKQNDMQEIVLVAHSMGAAMSAYYLSKNSDSAISRFIAVGLNAKQKNPKMNGSNSIKSIKIPMLDLYGSVDLPQVLETAKPRADAGKHNKQFSQQVVSGANHFFDDKNAELLDAVNNWLK